MLFRFSADGVLILHLAFIVFALLGGVLAARWRWMPFVHLPAASWGVLVELTGGICPLTHLENHFRVAAGQSGYTESFIEHYVLAIIYPAGITQGIQFLLAGVVLAFNIAIYGWLFARRRHGANGDA